MNTTDEMKTTEEMLLSVWNLLDEYKMNILIAFVIYLYVGGMMSHLDKKITGLKEKLKESEYQLEQMDSLTKDMTQMEENVSEIMKNHGVFIIIQNRRFGEIVTQMEDNASSTIGKLGEIKGDLTEISEQLDDKMTGLAQNMICLAQSMKCLVKAMTCLDQGMTDLDQRINEKITQMNEAYIESDAVLCEKINQTNQDNFDMINESFLEIHEKMAPLINKDKDKDNQEEIQSLVNKIKKHYEIVENIKTWRTFTNEPKTYQETPMNENLKNYVSCYIYFNIYEKVEIMETTRKIMDKYFTNYGNAFTVEKDMTSLCDPINHYFNTNATIHNGFAQYTIPHYMHHNGKHPNFQLPKIMFPNLDETEDEFEIRFLKELLSVCEKVYMRLKLYEKVCEANTVDTQPQSFFKC